MKKSYFFLSLILTLGACSKPPVSFQDAEFSDLNGWNGQNFEKSVELFKRNCPSLIKRVSKKSYKLDVFGSASAWEHVCNQAQNVVGHASSEQFFKDHFKVVEVQSQKPSLFTGYYAPIIQGSLVKTIEFSTPLYEKPQDLYTADLGLFDPEFKGKRLIVRVDEKTKRIKPYYVRAEIEDEKHQAKPFVWLDPVDAFFLHIQGSGYIKLASGDVLHVGYGGNNGHKYKAIGRTLIENKWMKKEDVTMQSLHTWLKENPDKRQKVFNSNPRYIFFREGNGQTTGSLGVPLTEGKSLAIDPNHIPLGVPLYVQTHTTYNQKRFNRMMFAEDTGAAIVGGVRGDIYFGLGEKAEKFAGAQNASGSLYVIVPK